MGLSDMDDDVGPIAWYIFAIIQMKVDERVGLRFTMAISTPVWSRKVLQNKLTLNELVPTSETEVVLTDSDPNVVKNWDTTLTSGF